MTRAVAKATLSFGLVSIPVKVYVAGCTTRKPFHWLSPHRHRIRLQYIDSITGEPIPREAILRGIEVEKDKFAPFTRAEWETICGGKRNLIEIREAVVPSALSYHNVCRPYYLLPDRSDKSYRILHAGLKKAKKVIVCQWYTRNGFDHLVVVYPTSTHLMMARLFYHGELREVELDFAKGTEPTSEEARLATALLDRLTTSRFTLDAHRPEFEARLTAAIEAKRASHHDLERLLVKSLKGRKK